MSEDVPRTAPSGDPDRTDGGSEDAAPSVSTTAILAAVFVIAISGLVYELLAGTVASYLLGDSVTQFSTVIGVYLSAMGLGAWLSGFVDKRLLVRFVEVELALALVGGLSSTFLFFAFSRTSAFQVILYAVVVAIGTLVGLELPLLLRILKDKYALKDLVQRVLTVDYVGALVAALAFPMFIVPKLGLVRGGLVVGSINALVALLLTFNFGAALTRPVLWRLRIEGALVLGVLLVGVAMSDRITAVAEDDLYADPIVFAETSHYQRIVITRGRASFQLFLNGNLQFASVDEHRYHEALVHPPLVVAEDLAGAAPKRVLVLGGGDGLAVREILKHPAVEHVTLVDLDPEMTRLAREHVLFVAQNGGALNDPRVEVVNADAMIWLASEPVTRGPRFDAIIIDFPDPNTFSLGKLYTTGFYKLVRAVLSPDGAIAVQATSPLLARRSFWCVAETLEAVGFSTRAYHATVPAFGEWGYVLAALRPFPVPARSPGVPTRYVDAAVLPGLFVFSPDMARIPADVNRLNNQVLVQYYEEEWSRWN